MSVILNCHFEDSTTEFENFISYKNALNNLLVINSCTIKDDESLKNCLNELKEKYSAYDLKAYDMSSEDTKYIVVDDKNFAVFGGGGAVASAVGFCC